MLNYLVKQLKVHPPLHVPLDNGEIRIESRYGTSTVSSSIKINKTSAVGDNVQIGERSRIGELCLIKSNLPDGTSVGDRVIIESGVLFNPERYGITIANDVTLSRGTRIKGPVFIGHGSTIASAEIGLRVNIGDDVHILDAKIPNDTSIPSHMYVRTGPDGSLMFTPKIG